MKNWLSLVITPRVKDLEAKGLSTDKIRRIAYHEAGHAIARCLHGRGDAIKSLDITPENGGYGRLAFKSDMWLPEVATRTEIEDDIFGRLAGRAAEEVVFGKSTVSNGAGSDLAAATLLALKMVAWWGMGESTGLFSIGEIESAQASAEFRAEANKILAEQYERALAAVSDNRVALNRISTRLLEKRKLTGSEVQLIFAEALMESSS